MAKAPDAFRTISEVSEWLETPAHVLRFWESKFREVAPVKRAGGRRYYRPEDMALLGGIKKLLHEDGMTIKGVQKLLRENGVAHVGAMAPELPGRVEEPSNVVDLRPAPATEKPAATPETDDMEQMALFAGIDIPADPSDTDSDATARLLAKIVGQNSATLAPRAKRLAPLAARLAAIHPQK